MNLSPGDWTAGGAIAAIGMDLIVLASAFIAYGRLQNEVRALKDGQAEDRKRMGEMETAIKEAASVGNKVDLLAAETRATYKLSELAQKASSDLLNAKMDGVLGEVRSFVSGQASAGLAHAAKSHAS